MCTAAADQTPAPSTQDRIFALLKTAKESVVRARLNRMGIGGVTCKRCRGTGRYHNGGGCFGCNGLGKWGFKFDTATLRALEAAEQDGSLAQYHFIWTTLAHVKRGPESLMKQWQATGISAHYHWTKVVEESQRATGGWNADVGAINQRMADAYKAIDQYAGKMAFEQGKMSLTETYAWAQQFIRDYETAKLLIAEAGEDLQFYLVEHAHRRPADLPLPPNE